MEGMTEEQKEHEAMKLAAMFDKLSRCVAWHGGPGPGQRRPPGWPHHAAEEVGRGCRFWQDCVTHVGNFVLEKVL